MRIFLIFILFFSNALSAIPESNRSRKVVEKVTPSLTSELSGKDLTLGSPIFIRIFKESKELEVWVKEGSRFYLFKHYRIYHFSGKLGPKLKEGDRQAPEGFYFVTPSRMNPYSRFHLSFNLGYPNKYDRALCRNGSALMVHGNTVSIGCFAMTDPLIEEIYTLADQALRNGQRYFRVHIFPFRMTKENMLRHKNSPWMEFWRNLKTGYDFFENGHLPPSVEVEKKMYTFEKSNE